MISKFKKKKKNSSVRNIFSFIFFLFFFICIFIILLVSNLKLKQKREQLLGQISYLETEIEKAKNKNEILRAQISQIESREYLEKVAREKFGLKAPGEEVVIITKEETKKENEIKEKTAPFSPKRWWEWIKEKISSSF